MEALATDTARGPLMLRPSPRPMLTLDMVDSTATVLVWAMAAVAMEVLATTARGPLMLRPSPRPMLTLDMVDSTATVLVWAMAMEALATDTATDCGARSKQNQIPRLTISYNTPNDLTGLYK